MFNSILISVSPLARSSIHLTAVAYQGADCTAWLLHRCVIIKGHFEICSFILEKENELYITQATDYYYDTLQRVDQVVDCSLWNVGTLISSGVTGTDPCNMRQWQQMNGQNNGPHSFTEEFLCVQIAVNNKMHQFLLPALYFIPTHTIFLVVRWPFIAWPTALMDIQHVSLQTCNICLFVLHILVATFAKAQDTPEQQSCSATSTLIRNTCEMHGWTWQRRSACLNRFVDTKEMFLITIYYTVIEYWFLCSRLTRSRAPFKCVKKCVQAHRHQCLDLLYVQPNEWPIHESLVRLTLCWPFKSKGSMGKQTLFNDLFVELSWELNQTCILKPTHNHSLVSEVFPWENVFLLYLQQRYFASPKYFSCN